jgi:hypothetical protein
VLEGSKPEIILKGHEMQCTFIPMQGPNTFEKLVPKQVCAFSRSTRLQELTGSMQKKALQRESLVAAMDQFGTHDARIRVLHQL